MKLVISILLLLITSLYVLPVKELLNEGTAICMVDIEDEKEESKKEKNKELFTSIYSVAFFDQNTCVQYSLNNIHRPFVLHTVETPPPDLA